MAHTWMDLNPMFSLTEEAAREAHARRPFLLIFNCAFFMFMAHLVINIPYETVSLISVALGLSKPSVWPVTFGRWRDAYTIRRFWG